MSELNFKSSVCTSSEQSEKLLALGLKKETADMYMAPSRKGGKIIGYYAPNVVLFEDYFDTFPNDLPAWSLHRLIEMIDDECIVHLKNFTAGGVVYYKHESLFDNIIDYIECKIKKGYFPKEYLV